MIQEERKKEMKMTKIIQLASKISTENYSFYQ